MPTYEFRCPKGHEFEKFYRSIGTAPSEVHCPECGALAERQLSTGAGLVFKGSGFYITDYGKDGKKDQRQSPGKVSGGSAETSSKKSDSGSSASTDSASANSSAASSDTKPASTSDAKSSSSADTKPAAAPAPAKKDSK
ncbi:MAG: zinc ribbon domain-containing protein [Gemmatimonadota bacterium]|nr:zinc ribbon domain-containing protein [Gemmatimonadota bacterium]